MSDIEWGCAQAEREERQARKAYLEQWELEVARANREVQNALTTYRWWGWTNIVNELRLFIQAWRLRLGGKVMR